jgi:hypothetical protein
MRSAINARASGEKRRSPLGSLLRGFCLPTLALLATREKWLPWLAPCEIEVPGLWADLPNGIKPAKTMKVPRILATLALARDFQRLLDTGGARNRADLARQFELTRARVTQVMKLLALAPEVVAHIESTHTAVSERALRPVLIASPEQQLRFVRARTATPRPVNRLVTKEPRASAALGYPCRPYTRGRGSRCTSRTGSAFTGR